MLGAGGCAKSVIEPFQHESGDETDEQGGNDRNAEYQAIVGETLRRGDGRSRYDAGVGNLQPFLLLRFLRSRYEAIVEGLAGRGIGFEFAQLDPGDALNRRLRLEFVQARLERIFSSARYSHIVLGGADHMIDLFGDFCVEIAFLRLKV